MKTVVAVNGSPRTAHNTATLVKQAAEGAASAGASVQSFDLYRLEKFTGCVSCFGCKTEKHLGQCVCRDGLLPVLDAIRHADGLILGSPNYLGDISAGVRALYERLIFPLITYKTEPRSYASRRIPVLFLMTSNAPEAFYAQIGYDRMLEGYQMMLEKHIGPTKLLISADTLQVPPDDYDRYGWDKFDAAAKLERHKTVFEEEKEKAFAFGQTLVTSPWA